MNNAGINENLRKYLWDYFQLHSSQRLATFNFFIFVGSLIATGFSLAISGMPFMAVILSIIMILFSFVFWKLDLRNRQIIKNAEEALIYLESKDNIADKGTEPHILNVFSYEQRQTAILKQGGSPWPWNWVLTYRVCFGIVFLMFGILGLAGLISSIIVLLTHTK